MSVVLSPEFKYVTEERLQEWKNPNPNPSGSSRVADPVPMTRFLYELCWAMVRGELPSQKCKIALDSVQFEEDTHVHEMGSILADIVAQFAQDLTVSGDHRARLVKMTKALVEASLVPARLLQERCEEEFLFEADLSRMKAQDLKSKEVRVNTRLLYQQTKFNLLREESEGYAKLVTLLCQGSLDPTSNNALVVTISIIKSLIGHFDLDPNRVFDIVLDCFELYPEKKIFYDLIPIFPKSHAAQILGFKFQYYQRMEVTTPVPSSLFNLAALMVKENFIELDSIYPHLLPQDEDAFMHYEGFLSKRIDEASKIGRINLAATGKDLMETEEKQDVSVDFYASWDLELDVLAERAPEVRTNQKLGLLIGFLSVHDWNHAQILFERLSSMNPVEHVEICEGLFRVIEKTISSAYKIVSKNYRPPCKSWNSDDVMEVDSPSTSSLSVDLPREFFQMLSVVGPYLHRDTALLQKICRVLRGYYVSMRDDAAKVNSPNSDESRRYKEARIRIEDAIGLCLLPSLQLIPANPAIGFAIWDVLSLLPYEVRYRLYGEWEKDDERNPLVLSARQLAKLDTRRILKRLAKENLKQLGRMVAKLAHANPMTVLRTIVQQIEAYKDMIMPVVDAFKYLTQLEYDILEYVVIERLAQGGRDKLKEDGLNLSDWLQSLASFWGSLCKKYPSMELRGLFQYLVNQLKKGSGTELVLLEELIEQMANVHYTENITEEQLDALAGSETLRYQSNLYGSTRNNKVLSKSTNRLRDSLLPKDNPKLAIPLLILIAQYRSMVILKADAPYIKMVSEQFDRCHGTLLQYVDFLSSAISPASAYAQFIPSLHDLSHKYHLEPEVAFLIYRPVMRLFKRPGSEGVCWPLDAGEEIDSEKGLQDFVLNIDSSQEPVRWSEFLNTVESMLPSKSWKNLSSDLYATFWGLTLYDLYVPKKRYEAEIAKQHGALKALEELSDTSSVAISKRKKDKEKIQELLDRLASEYWKHEKHVESVRQMMAREKDRWLSNCPEPVKINMEFLQRCVFPRSICSATDAAYCAAFVRMLHSLGTPFFNTLQHIDLLICKLLQPMICCCTELEAGRFGRFLCETLKMAYDWKKDESVYERECANMPGFALYYKFPHSQRVSFPGFVRVHFKWSQKITRVLVQCLESTEYMEIRNALIVLTKISSVFPVMRKSGLNIEKRVAKIKGDEREDLKVLATGVAAALASHKSSWVSDEEFGMGHLETKPAASPAKAPPPGNNNHIAVDSVSNPPKEHNTRHKSTTDAKNERSNGAASRLPDEHPKAQSEEPSSRTSRPPADSETRALHKQRGAPSILGKPPKLEDGKSGKISESGPDSIPTTATNGKSSQRGTSTSNATVHVSKVESGTVARTSHEHIQKRAVQNDEQERVAKRRKGEERERETESDKDREKERENDRSSRDRADDRHEKEQRDREKQRERERERERSMERRDRDRSLERGGKDEREREKLPPPPPLPPSFVPQSVSRHSVEREREREKDDDVNKRRRGEDNRDGRKREDRDGSSSKVEEREQDKLKEDSEANAKRRKVKRSSSTEPGEYSPAVPSSHSYDTRGERKGAGIPHRGVYGDENARSHSKDPSSKANRRDTDQSHERDFEEDKRQRAETKRKHRK
ncbi:THO complex subunit 2 [Rhynchospora pubera]|uniref:THO complex subunit 2 n=1 Tax=Rhynchospora pubera TaxID=906938 RepID=A0AAV8H5S4_9POAL|nr:THO complex subunit 2 [Rhynchospora pubera]